MNMPILDNNIEQSKQQSGLCALNLHFVQSENEILRDLSFCLEPYGCSAIMGANGAGKTITLKLLHGLLPLQHGQILINGRSISKADRLNQTMVFQRPILLDRTVIENITHILRNRKIPKNEAKERANTWLKKANLAEKSNQPALTLSGGEQQRLATARALSIQPELLFLDEPTTNLDPGSNEIIEGLILEARHGGMKIVLVTHSIGQAKRLADEIVFLDAGKLIAQGPIDNFFEQGFHEKIMSFVKASS